MTRIFFNFLEDPFKTIDSINLQWLGFQFNLLRDDKKLCKALLEIFVAIPLICWILLGSDSTVDQVAWLLFNIPKLITGQINFNQWTSIYVHYYGLGTHWSASVIYGLLFVGVSRYLREKLETYNSYNLAVTTGFVGLAIGSFEFFWMGSYYFFQKQSWILSLQLPQLRILLMNLLFLVAGLIVILGMDWKKYTLNFNRRTIFFLCSTIFFVLLWYNYPFEVQQVTVDVQGYGTWINSPNFPQTMYTVDLDVTDQVAVGEMFNADNPGVHFVNNVCKIFWTLTIYNLAKIKIRSEKLVQISIGEKGVGMSYKALRFIKKILKKR